jgi:hypothetical protein
VGQTPDPRLASGDSELGRFQCKSRGDADLIGPRRYGLLQGHQVAIGSAHHLPFRGGPTLAAD